MTALNRIGFPPVSMLVDELLQGDHYRSVLELVSLGPNLREAIPALPGPVGQAAPMFACSRRSRWRGSNRLPATRSRF